jgi:solute carrier family 13 (sodium-dependent dicarboxylate transporter), member 2/3/5
LAVEVVSVTLEAVPPEADQPARGNMGAKTATLLGPATFAALVLFGPPEGMTEPGWAVLSLLAWMAIWWIAEAIPIAATALLPLVVLPMVGATDARGAAAPYADPIIFLFIGGFILAASVERWGLHRRLALAMLARAGSRTITLLAAFMLVTAALSMWISNIAATLMLMPIAMGVARTLGSGGRADPVLGGALALGVAYSASIGGIGTPVGTPTNLVAVGYLARQGLSIPFTSWMAAAVPLMLVLLALTWAVLAWPLRARGRAFEFQVRLASERATLGTISIAECRVVLVFSVVALGWMFRPLLADIPGLGGLNDTAIAVAGAIALFLVPSGTGVRLMDWNTAERIPWGIALLFGGGLALAAAMDTTGVTTWLGSSLGWMGQLAPVLIVALIVGIVIFATEFASNTATLTAFLPVVGGVALATGVDPLILVFPASIAASLAFMMPIGTPPNAVAYASGMVSLKRMVTTGLVLNLISVVAVVAMSLWLAPHFID